MAASVISNHDAILQMSIFLLYEDKFSIASLASVKKEAQNSTWLAGT